MFPIYGMDQSGTQTALRVSFLATATYDEIHQMIIVAFRNRKPIIACSICRYTENLSGGNSGSKVGEH